MFDNLDNKNIELLPHTDKRNRGKKKDSKPRQVEYSKPTKISKANQVQFLKKQSGGWLEKIKSFFQKDKSAKLAQPQSQPDPVKKTTSPLSKLYQKNLQSSSNKQNASSNQKQPDSLSAVESDHAPVPHQKSANKKAATRTTVAVDAFKNNDPFQRPSDQAEPDNSKNTKEKKDKIVGFQYDINLIREEFVPVVDKKKILTTFALASLLAVLLVVFIYFLVDFVKFGRTKKIKELEVSLQQVEAALAQKQQDLVEIADYYQTVNQIKSLLDQHVYWTNLLEFIETNTLTTVYYDSIRATRNGAISLSAKAKDYESVHQQFLVFKNHPAVADIEINNASIDGDARSEIMERILNDVVQNNNTTSTPTSTIITFAEQQRILRDTLQRLPIEFNINLVVKPELFLRDQQGRSLIKVDQ